MTDDWSRRALLASVGAAIAGCASSDDTSDRTPSESQPMPDGSKSPTATPGTPNRSTQTTTIVEPIPDESFPRTVTVNDVHDANLRETFDVTADVAILDKTVTAANTARVAVDLQTATGEQRELTYTQRHCTRNEWRAETDGIGLYLFPAGPDWTRDDTSCPVIGPPNLSCGVPPMDETVTVPATSSLRWEYDVLVPPRNLDQSGCVVPGEYRFSREFTTSEHSAPLSFALSVGS